MSKTKNNGAPCKGCTDRVLGCHSTCKKYIDFKLNNEELNRKIRKQGEITGVLNRYSSDKARGLSMNSYRNKK